MVNIYIKYAPFFRRNSIEHGIELWIKYKNKEKEKKTKK